MADELSELSVMGPKYESGQKCAVVRGDGDWLTKKEAKEVIRRAKAYPAQLKRIEKLEAACGGAISVLMNGRQVEQAISILEAARAETKEKDNG